MASQPGRTVLASQVIRVDSTAISCRVDLTHFSFRSEYDCTVLYLIIIYLGIEYRAEAGIYPGSAALAYARNKNKFNFTVNRLLNKDVEFIVKYFLRFNKNRTYVGILSGLDFGHCNIK